MMSDGLSEHFMNKVCPEPNSGCWIWMGGTNGWGYGEYRMGRGRAAKRVRAHRYAYGKVVGLIPEGRQIDHLCRVRCCVNPSHLEAVTPRENTIRGDAGKAWAAIQRTKTHCPRGHPYSGDNLMLSPEGHRKCRTCARARRLRRAGTGVGHTGVI